MSANVKSAWINSSFFWLFLVAVLGLLLRVSLVIPMPFTYKYVLHAHSHLAFLGWVFTSLFTLIVYSFLSPQQQVSPAYKWQFILTQVANVGMLVSFPLQGYALYSIIFSSMHMFVSFWFAHNVLRDVRKNERSRTSLAVRFLRAAIFFMILSSLGPLSLAPIMKLYGAGSNMYYNAIYFYLHFQYNGWFSFTLLALLARHIEIKGISYDQQAGNTAFVLFAISCVPAYFLSVLWSHPPQWIYLIAAGAGVLQIAALYFLLRSVWPARRSIIASFISGSKFPLLFAFVFFLLKIFLQFLSGWPSMAEMIAGNHFFIIGYLHMVLLGFVTFTLFGLYALNGMLQMQKMPVRIGIACFITGFVLSELLLVGQGMMQWLQAGSIPGYFTLLAVFSILLPLGAGLLWVSRLVKVKDAIQVNYRIAHGDAVQ